MADTETKTLTIVRLEASQLQAFISCCGGTTFVDSSQTELQVAWQLGVQHAVNILRQGFTLPD